MCWSYIDTCVSGSPIVQNGKLITDGEDPLFDVQFHGNALLSKFQFVVLLVRGLGPLAEGAVSAADWGSVPPFTALPPSRHSPCHLPQRGRQGVRRGGIRVLAAGGGALLWQRRGNGSFDSLRSLRMT